MLLESERHYIGFLMRQGLTVEQVRDDLISIGWHQESAKNAVEEFVSDNPVPTLGPRPNLDNLPSRLRLDGQDMQVQLRAHRPQLCLVSDFLSDTECNAVIDESRSRLARSKVIAGDGDINEQGVQTYLRTSDQANFPRGSSSLVDRIWDRVAAFTVWPSDYMESPHVVRYRVGADFGAHHDYFCPTAHKGLIEREGQRIASVLLYLSTPETGGITAFPDLELEIYPQRGNALFFAYPKAHPDSMTLHSGVPLGSGEKWIATFFLRDRVFRSGKQ